MEQGSGVVEAIHLAASHGDIPVEVESAVAHPGRGLEGDRHFDRPGACDITLIEAEALDQLGSEHGLALPPAASRRQVLVRGMDLGDLIGAHFTVGDVECVGDKRCEPCNHLAEVVHSPAVLTGLLHTGLRARIVHGGTIRRGDVVRPAGARAAAGPA